MALPDRRLALDEFLRLPERKPALEFEEGTVAQKMSPKDKHSALQGGVAALVNSRTRERRVALALVELRTTFAGRSYVPDVAIYQWDRIPRDAAGHIANDFVEPPDASVEIVSPKQSVMALIRKCIWYVEHGVGAALIVDDGDESVLVVRPGVLPRPILGQESVDLDDIIPGLALTAAELFGALRVE